jgi:putative oxidoreductase
MKSIYLRCVDWFARIPADLIALLARISVGTVFLRSGLLKLEGWESGTTLSLFETEYTLPFVSPNVAMHLATAAELTFPFLLFAGLFTRFAALALLIMTLVIQIFIYPNAFDTHGTWAVAFLFLMKYGPGHFSLDYLLFGDRLTSHPTAVERSS